jgi:hypothetical protein
MNKLLKPIHSELYRCPVNVLCKIKLVMNTNLKSIHIHILNVFVYLDILQTLEYHNNNNNNNNNKQTNSMA